MNSLPSLEVLLAERERRKVEREIVEKMPPGLRESIERRAALNEKLGGAFAGARAAADDEEIKYIAPDGAARLYFSTPHRTAAQQAELAHCAADPVYWFNSWVWTYDPRVVSASKSAWLPFDLFPRQVDFVNWLVERIDMKEEGLCEKSRGVGFTWLAGGVAVHKWLFSPGFKTTFGSRVEQLVDAIGDPDSIFEKIRLLIYRLPAWMRPVGFNKSVHDNFMRIVNPENGNIIGGAAGEDMGRGGRSQPLDAKILTPFGWSTMGDMRPGSFVTGANGAPTRVIDIFPQGEEMVYRVTFSDGASTECGGDHLWQVTDRSCRKVIKRKGNRTYGARHLTLKTSELAENLRVKRGDEQTEWRYRAPIVQPAIFTETRPPLDPYLVGALLGDGSMSQIDRSSAGFTTADAEMVSLLNERLPSGYALKKSDALYSYRITNISEKGARPKSSAFKEKLRFLGLGGHKAATKSIPYVYKFGSVEARLEMIRGLLDTDGWVTTRGAEGKSSKVCFGSISRQLIDDLQFVIQSLGGVATVGSRAGVSREFPGGRNYDCAQSYTLIIAMPPGMNPFRMKRKAEKYRERSLYKPRRSIISIEPVGIKETQCIIVDASDSLYVTDHCIVTHNSTLFFVDEGAFVSHAERVEAAISENSDCRVWASTVNGHGNLFAKKRFGGGLSDRQIFRFHWRDDPRRDDAWAAKKKKSLAATPHLWGSEFEIDYSASVEGLCIPAAWVDAACRLGQMMEVREIGDRIGGLDIGAGRAKSVFIWRAGPVVSRVETRKDPDTTDTAHWAVGLAGDSQVKFLKYDSVGVGFGVTSTFSKMTDVPFKIVGVNVGNPASETVWEDRMKSVDKFVNLKAEAWWFMRERFRATHEHVQYLDAVKNEFGAWDIIVPDDFAVPEGAARHEMSDVIAIAADQADLRMQLSLPKWFKNEKGKIMLESKIQLATRGITSPDLADALALTHVPEHTIKQAGFFAMIQAANARFAAQAKAEAEKAAGRYLP